MSKTWTKKIKKNRYRLRKNYDDICDNLVKIMEKAQNQTYTAL